MMTDEEIPDTALTAGAKSVARQLWRHGQSSAANDWVATETPVALVFNCISHAVMMATPTDLEDFALGFSLSEGIIDSPDELLDVEIQNPENGIVIEISIPGEALDLLKRRRRNLSGRTGCGVCGAQTIDQAIEEPKVVSNIGFEINHQAIQKAIKTVADTQGLRNQTGAVHGAMWCDLAGNVMLTREDVGRHNALDKLIGALARNKKPDSGFALISSRASYEMVSKAASADIQLLVAVSAPTSLAIEMASLSGIGLVGFGREGHHAVYHGAEKLVDYS